MQVPTRRFGRTEVQMPVLTCGGMRYNLLGNADHGVPGQQAVEVEKQDGSCLAESPFAERIPGILKEAHAAFHVEEEAKRFSES